MVIVKSSDYFVVRGLVENLLYLLQERFAVQLGGRHKCVFSEKDVLALDRGVEVLVQQV